MTVTKGAWSPSDGGQGLGATLAHDLLAFSVMYNSCELVFPTAYLPCASTARLLFKSLGHGAPVDDLPDGAKVLGLAVLVLQVVGVLPGVDAEQGLEVAGDGVLVGAGDEAEGARRLVLDEPGPAGALDAGESGVGLLLEVAKGTKVLVDGGLRGVSHGVGSGGGRE